MLRALDYLPPGEVSFRDYAWAVVASDTVSHPETWEAREKLLSEFVRRGVEISQDEVDEQLYIETPALDGVDRRTLVESDWAAFDFVTNHPELFLMPKDVPFMLRPRLDVTKRYYHRGGREKDVRELIFKVSWDDEEDNPLGRLFPEKRLLTVGTTLAISWDEPEIRARLTHSLSDQQAQDRTDFLKQTIADGTLIPDRPVTSKLSANRRVLGMERSDSRMRVSGTGMMLHVAGPMVPRREGE
jgi:hypothetical protein